MKNVEKIELIAGERAYNEWSEIHLLKSMNSLTGSFSLSTNYTKDITVEMEDFAEIEINDILLTSGHIDNMPLSYGREEGTILIEGRNKTGDLVDCPHEGEPNEWKRQTIGNITSALCAPFGIPVSIDPAVADRVKTRLDEFKANEGELVVDLIGRLCRTVGIIPLSYGDGKLTLTAASQNKANDSIVLGENALYARKIQSDRDRYSVYTVKGVGRYKEGQDLSAYLSPSATIKDNVIKRHRPLVVFAETSSDRKQCYDRAVWEYAIRAGFSRCLEYTMEGWTQSNGAPWDINQTAYVDDSYLDINKTMLIAAVQFILDENEGLITKLLIVDPNTYELDPGSIIDF
ncbi:MAG: hypothetical protein GY757_09200 [bacterium]|nr:hypothetical protein [bacterium]